MTSAEYKRIIARIVDKLIRQRFPGLKATCRTEVSRDIARHIHARMYGANIDGVDSPIWRLDKLPTIDAAELLNSGQMKTEKETI